MIALRLVRLIEEHSDELADSIVRKFQSSPRTLDLSKVPAQELRLRTHDVLQHLSEWLLAKTESDIEELYRSVGERRASQGVALADMCWAFVLIKEELWSFLSRQGFLRGPLEIYGELELLRLLDQFFDHAIGYCAEGYQQALEARVGVTLVPEVRHGRPA